MIKFGMETCRRQRMVDAAHEYGYRYAPSWGMHATAMMMINLMG